MTIATATPTERNAVLLSEIKSREERLTEFGYGITTADAYVRSVRDCIGSAACYKYASTSSTSFEDVLRKAAKTLVYSNPEMELEKILYEKVPSAVQPNDLDGIELPKHTLMVFRHVLTTPRKDRDNDILRTEGAKVDPKMLLLWQHIHTLPIGKMLSVVQHDSNKLVLISAIIGKNELAQDAAVMIDSGMGRFSHGFRALEFETLKEEEGETTSPGGFDIKSFEIMEESLVSVPSNTDAETEEILLGMVEGGKLTSPIMRSQGRAIRARRPLSVNIKFTEKVGEYERSIEGPTSESIGDVIREVKDADKPGTRSIATEGKACGCGDGPSKETDVVTADQEQTQDAEVKRIAPGSLDGSWEHIEAQLRTQAGRFLGLHGVDTIHRFVWIAGTFADHAILCSEHERSGVEGEFKYFRATWEVVDDDPKFTGNPEEVEITFSVETTRRSPLFESKNPETDKAGRTLSQRNLRILLDVKEDIGEVLEKEADISRGGKAMLTRSQTSLGTVITAATGDDAGETEYTPPTMRDAIAFIVGATMDDRKQIADVLKTLKEVQQREKRVAEYNSLVGVV